MFRLAHRASCLLFPFAHDVISSLIQERLSCEILLPIVIIDHRPSRSRSRSREEEEEGEHELFFSLCMFVTET